VLIDTGAPADQGAIIEEEKKAEESEEEHILWRDELPKQKDPAEKASLFKVMKDMVGKDISKFEMPVY